MVSADGRTGVVARMDARGKQQRGLFVVAAVVGSALVGAVARGTSPAEGSLDPTFGSGGKVTTSIGGSYDRIFDALVQPDGKILVVGGTKIDSTEHFGVARFTSAGVLDPTFGSGGKAHYPVGGSNPSTATAVALQSDGRIIVAGYRTTASRGEDPVAIRLSSAGVHDLTFGTSGYASASPTENPDPVYTVAVLEDDSIVLGGRAGFSQSLIVKFGQNGSLDAAFGSGGVTMNTVAGGSEVWQVIPVATGHILAVGPAYAPSTNNDYALARYSSTTGALDSSFGGGAGSVTVDLAGFNDDAFAVTVQSDGKILVGGTSWQDGTNYTMAVTRFSSDGVIDVGFGSSGKKVIDFGVDGLGSTIKAEMRDMALDASGRIIAVGTATGASGPAGPTDMAVVRLNGDGSPDSSFGVNGVSTFDVDGADGATALAIQDDHRLVVAGHSAGVNLASGDFAAIRVHVAGPVSSDATLASLTPSAGTLTPAFSSGTTSYSLTVPNSTKTVNLTATRTDPGASIALNGSPVSSGSPVPVALAPGVNSINVVVTAEDDTTTKTYAVTVTRDVATLKVKKTMTAKSAMASVDKTIPAGAKVVITVAKSSKSRCAAVSGSIRGIKAGTCTVTISVTPKPTKAVKKPKAVKTSIAIRIT